MKQEARSSEVGRLRREIDEVDSELVGLIAKRRDLALEVAKLKQEGGSGLKTGGSKRIEDILKKIEEEAGRHGLDSAEMKRLWKCLVRCMIKEQMKSYPYEPEAGMEREILNE